MMVIRNPMVLFKWKTLIKIENFQNLIDQNLIVIIIKTGTYI